MTNLPKRSSHNTHKKEFTVQEAAEFLNVSSKTLRRWDTAGKLSPKRTAGGHRRYLLSDIKRFQESGKQTFAKIAFSQPPKIEDKNYVPQIPGPQRVFVNPQSTLKPTSPITDKVIQTNTDQLAKPTEIVIQKEEFPNLYDQLPEVNKKVIRTTALVFSTLFFFTLATKAIAGPAQSFISQNFPWLSPNQKLSNNNTNSQVLAAEAIENPVFGVNVDAIFRGTVNFLAGLTSTTIDTTGDANIGGNLLVTGNTTAQGDVTVNGALNLNDDLVIAGSLLSTEETVELLNEGSTTINIGGEATTITLGATTGNTTINNNLIVTGTSDLGGAVTLDSTLAVSGSSTLSGAVTTGSTLTVGSTLDVNGTGTNDIAGTLNLSGNILSSSGDLSILPGGGGISIGTGTAGDIDLADGDLYITDDLEVDGVIYGTFSGSVSTGFTQGSVVFIDSAGGLDEDNNNFFWNDTTNRLGIGNTNPQYAVDITGTLHATGGTTLDSTLNVAGATTFTNTLDVTLAGRFLSTLEVGGNIDFNGTGTNDIAGTLNLSGNTLTSSGDLVILATGGGTKIGNGTPVSANMAGDDLYVTGDFEVGGTIYGGLSGTVTTSFSQGSIVFINGGGNLAEDNSNFFWDDTNNRLSLGTNSGATTTLYVSGTSLVTGASTFNGNVTLGDAGTDDITVGGEFVGHLIPNTSSLYDLGTASRTWETLYVDNIVAANISTTATDLNGTSALSFTINNDNATSDTESSSLVFDRGVAAVNALLGWDSTTPSTSALGKMLYVNSSTFAVNPSGETGITYSGKAALLVNQVQNQDLITASSSGSPRFKVDVNGEITASGIGKMVIVDGLKYPRTCAGINAAIDALGSDGGEVYLPEASYTCTEQIVIDQNNTTIRGAGKGSKIVVSAWASWGTPGHIINLNGKDYLTLKDFQIDGTLVKGGGQSFSLIASNGSAVTYSLFDGLYLLKSDNNGIHLESSSSHDIITNSVIEDSDNGGAVLGTQGSTSVTDSRVSNSIFLSNDVVGVQVSEQSSRNDIVNNEFTSNAIGVQNTQANSTTIHNNIFNTQTGTSINIPTNNNASQMIITNNRIVQSSGQTGISHASQNANNGVIANNIITGGSIGISVSTNGGTTLVANNISTSTTPISVGTNAAATTTVISTPGGNLALGGVDNTPDTTVEIAKASGEDASLSMTDGDVAHGLTTLVNTDAFFHVSPISSTAGGAYLTAVSDTNAQAMGIRGVIGSTDPTDATPAVRITGAKSNGTTGVADLGALETVFAVANNDDSDAFTILGNGSITHTSSASTTTANLFTADSVTTGTGLSLSADGLSTGNGMYLESTSTAFSSGNLASLYWNPGSSTTATGDLLRLNVGSNGTLGNILNVMNNSSSVFSVSQAQITSALPHQFTAAGDVSIAYDLQFTNQTASYIKSLAPLYIEAGESFENNDLTLRTYGTGNAVFDLTGTGKLQAVGTDSSLVFDTRTATDTDFWLGIQDDAGSDDDDTFQIGDGTTPGTNPWFVLDTSGKIGIGSDTTPDYQLEINAASSADPTFALTDGDVAHGVTTLANTDAILHIGAISSTDGGTQLTAFADNVASAQALSIRGILNSDPTDTVPAIKLLGARASGTGIADLGAAETVFQVANNDDTSALTIQGNGDVGIGTTNPTNKLHVVGTSSSATFEVTGSTLTIDTYGGAGTEFAATGHMTFRVGSGLVYLWHTGSTEMMRMHGDGSLVVGADSSPNALAQLTVRNTDAENWPSLAIDTEESTATVDAWFLQSDSTNNSQSADTTKATINVDGSFQISLTGTQTTNGLCHAGSGQDNNDEVVDCSGAPSDYAEWYPVDTNVTAGDVVAVSNNSFEYDAEGSDPFTGTITSLGKDTISILNKATTTKGVIGIVSTGPYSTIGEDVKKSVEKSGNGSIKPAPIALSGRVPVKVSASSDDIQVGDMLTVSPTDPGKVIKATTSTYTVGKALQSWTKASGKQTVLVFVGNSYFADLTVNMDGSGNVLGSQSTNTTNQDTTQVNNGNTQTQEQNNIPDYSSELDTLNTKVTNLEDKLNQVMSDLDIVKGQTVIATSSATLNLDETSIATESAQLTTSDNITTLGDTVVTGKLNIGLLTLDSQTNSLDAVGDLNIQKLALGNVKFFDGLIEFDTKGNVKAKEIQAEKFTVLGDSAGKAVLPEGEKEVFITTNQVTKDSLIMVTPTTTTPYPLTVTEKVEGEGFKVEMSIWASEDIQFDWFIIDHKPITTN